MNSDTIAAIATAMSPSGIGIIRISGEDTLDIIDRIYRSKDGKKKISKCKSYTIHYGYIYDGDEVVDEVMVLLMKAPNSYTREDTVEIDCHGGVCDKEWSASGRAWRIYQACVFEWTY